MRVTAEQEALIRHAASLADETVTAFVLGTATRRASELVEAQRTVTLPNETFDRFVAGFICGVDELDRWLRRHAVAAQQMDRRAPSSSYETTPWLDMSA